MGSEMCIRDSYVVEQFDDMRASVNYVGSFARVFDDPRMVSYHAGGHVHPNAGGRTRTLNPLDELEVSTFPFGPVYLAFRVRPTA